MVISRTPFRISFFGGGTDYPVWYEKNGGGSVISTSINKYCYITCRLLPPFFKYNYRIRYNKQEHVRLISQIKHPSVRECLNFLNFPRGVEIQHNADLPAKSGLGSSSSFTVGLLNALYALKGMRVSKKKLALNSIHVEQNLIQESVGSQDQTIASYGGFNRIDFNGKEKIKVSPIPIKDSKLYLLQEHLMLFYTGRSRNASELAKLQIKKTPSKSKELKQMIQIVDEAYKVLVSNSPIDEFGKLLDTIWKIKRGLTYKISNSFIDEIYQTALKNGATGGKLLGAGGGGFMLIFSNPDYHERIRQALKKLLFVPFKFEKYGSQIIYRMPEDDF